MTIAGWSAGDGDMGSTQAAAPLQVKVGSFPKRVGVGNQQVTGVGFRPKALLLFGTTQEAEGLAGGYQVSMGFSDGTNDGSVGGWSWDHNNPPTGGSDADCAQVDESGNPAALLYVETMGNIAASATVNSFDSDGFTLNWQVDEDGKQWLIHYLAIGGDELTNSKVGLLGANNDQTGEVTYTGLGFQPDIVFFLGVRYATAYPHANFPLNLALGFATDQDHQGTVAVASEDSGRNPTDTWRYQRTDKAIAFLWPTSGALESEAEFVSMDPDGFILDWTDAASENRSFYYLALKGGSYYVGSETQKIGETGAKATTGVGFDPSGLLFASFNRTSSLVNEPNNRFSLGAADGENSATIWVGDSDNILNDTHTDKASFSTEALALADSDDPTTVAAIAELNSLDSDGFTLNWAKVDSQARQFLFVAFGSALSQEGTPTPTATPSTDTDGDTVLDHMDNCPHIYNPDQTNADGGGRPNGSQIPGEWARNPAQDSLGDACDSDDDNDGSPDSGEGESACPFRIIGDSDSDRSLDGYEANAGKDPCSAASKPVCAGSPDSDGDGFSDCVENSGYNTCAFAGDVFPGYTICANPVDSDGDSCADWIEIVDVNGSGSADILDVLFVAKRALGIIPASDSDAVLDIDKSGVVNILDALVAAKNSSLVRAHSPCP